MACKSSVMVRMVILGSVVSVQREMNIRVQWPSVFKNIRGGSSLFPRRGTLCQMLHFPVYVVPDFPRMLFSYLFTTSSPVPLLFHRLYLLVAHCFPVVSDRGEKSSADSCNSHLLSCLQVTRGVGQNGRNF